MTGWIFLLMLLFMGAQLFWLFRQQFPLKDPCTAMVLAMACFFVAGFFQIQSLLVYAGILLFMGYVILHLLKAALERKERPVPAFLAKRSPGDFPVFLALDLFMAGWLSSFMDLLFGDALLGEIYFLYDIELFFIATLFVIMPFTFIEERHTQILLPYLAGFQLVSWAGFVWTQFLAFDEFLTGYLLLSLFLIYFGIYQNARGILTEAYAREMYLKVRQQDLEQLEARKTSLQDMEDTYRTTLQSVLEDLENGMDHAALEKVGTLQNGLIASRAESFTTRMPLNAMLNQFHHQCEAKGIRFDVNIQYLPESIQSLDLCILCSNLVENAMRAACQSAREDPKTESFVSFSCLHEPDQISVVCINTCTLSPLQVSHQQGLGKRIIREIARRYDGSVNQQWNGFEYRSDITLLSPEGEGA